MNEERVLSDRRRRRRSPPKGSRPGSEVIGTDRGLNAGLDDREKIRPNRPGRTSRSPEGSLTLRCAITSGYGLKSRLGGEPLRQTPTGVPTAIRCRLSGLKRTSLFPASRMSVVDPKPSFRMRHGRNGYSQPRFHCLLPGVTKRSLVWGNRAPERVATPGARQRPPPDAENNGGEVS
jgi:hypothetical protein